MNIRKQITNELHKKLWKNFARRKVILKGINDLFQADLVEMGVYSKVNNGYKYILTIIDGFSKYAWAIPLKSKTEDEVCTAFTKLFENSKRVP